MKTRYLARLVIGTLTVLGGTFAAGCGSARWETSYDEAMRRATEQRQRVLVEFVSSMCPGCMDMNMNVFPAPEVDKLMQKFVPVRLDIMIDKELARHLNVQTTPSFYVIRHDGQVVGAHAGAMELEQFQTFLIKYSYN